jgi:glycerophosphoryl diester phosphodiesterase
VNSPLAIAHRGGAAEAPENTLAAFRHSLALGIRWFELDVQLSLDCVPVVFHDGTVARTTNGTGEVGSLTLGELRHLDAGAWFGPQFAGERIPTLREVLDLCASEGAGVLIELKSPHLYPGIEQKVVSLLRPEDTRMRVRGGPDIWCISFDADCLRCLRALDGQLPLGQLYRSDVADFAAPDDTVQAVLPHFSLAALHPEQVTRAHEQGKQVFVWTVNEAEDMKRMVALGVDGIVSDWPSLLMRNA